MTRWHDRSTPLARSAGTHHAVLAGDAPLSFIDAIRLLDADADFREWFGATLAASPAVAFRWETPALSTTLATRPFEFVLIEDRYLDRTPDADAFAAHFRGTTADALAIPNLGRTSELIVPRGNTPHGQASHANVALRTYVHLAAFLRGAPATQIHALWRCVAATVLRRMSDRPLWLSTAGAGVAWLHVRVDPTPKYYAHAPYRSIAPA